MVQVLPVSSPNYSDVEISVEFVVLHYTATTLERTLEIFGDARRQVSSHLVIDRDGAVYEVVQCLRGPALKAWHAGKSRLSTSPGVVREGFNDCSIGIELVNLNGNVFPYSEAQYRALCDVLQLLRKRYPPLSTPQCLLGHEDIAGFRGKCDPGRRFDWPRVFAAVFPATIEGPALPERVAICSERMAQALEVVYREAGIGFDEATGLFTGVESVPRGLLESVSSLVEAAVELSQGAISSN